MSTDAQHLEAVRYLRAYLDPNEAAPGRPEGLDHLIAAVEEELSAHDSDDQQAALRFLEAELAGPEPEAVAWRAVKPHVYPLPRHIRRALELATLRAKVEGLEEQIVEECAEAKLRVSEHAQEAKTLARQVEAMKADKDSSFRRGHAAGAKAYQLRFRELSEHLRSLDLQPYTMPPTLARLLEACEQVPSPGPDAILAAAADWREAGALRPGRLERQTIETLPKAREEAVLAGRMNEFTSGRPRMEAWVLHPGVQPKPAEWWCPMPPMAKE